MLIDIVGRNSLLPRGEPALHRGLGAKLAAMQTQKLIRQSRARQNSIDPLAKDARLNVPISWLCALGATTNAKSKRSLSRVGAWPWAKAQLDGELRRELFSRGRYDL